MGFQSFLNHFHVIVTSAAQTGPLQQSSHHLLLAALKIEDKGSFGHLFGVHSPIVKVFKVTREAIDQKMSIPLVTVNCCLDELRSDKTGDDLPI